jgi:DNA repair exonuclease SbcCD ATPase subunit
MSMSATVASLPPDHMSETIDFLRRLASMMAGGRNAESLLGAADLIETLSRRATAAETLHHDLQEDHRELGEDHAKNREMREVAELAVSNLTAEVASLKTRLAEGTQRADAEIASLTSQLAASTQRADAEITSLKTQLAAGKQQAEADIASLKAELAASNRQAEQDRIASAADARRLQANADLAEARLADVSASLAAAHHRETMVDNSAAAIPLQSLQLALTQFGYLAEGFARSGDIISLTICEIGACAIDSALAAHAPAKEPN